MWCFHQYLMEYKIFKLSSWAKYPLPRIQWSEITHFFPTVGRQIEGKHRQERNSHARYNDVDGVEQCFPAHRYIECYVQIGLVTACVEFFIPANNSRHQNWIMQPPGIYLPHCWHIQNVPLHRIVELGQIDSNVNHIAARLFVHVSQVDLYLETISWSESCLAVWFICYWTYHDTIDDRNKKHTQNILFVIWHMLYGSRVIPITTIKYKTDISIGAYRAFRKYHSITIKCIHDQRNSFIELVNYFT